MTRTQSFLIVLALLLPSAVLAQPEPWTLLQILPRAPQHFTQGLVFSGNQLLESTGRYGQSALFAYDAKTLLEKKRIKLPDTIFGEGLTVLDSEIYQLSWKAQKIFVYNQQLQLLKTLSLQGEGWGLTTDGVSLILSNGSDTLQFLDPESGKLQRKLIVHDGSTPQKNINELEWVEGYILANLWLSNTVLLIDSNDGDVIKHYDFSALATINARHQADQTPDDVLNGLAWNPTKKTLWLTGKNWPLWFEVALMLPQRQTNYHSLL